MAAAVAVAVFLAGSVAAKATSDAQAKQLPPIGMLPTVALSNRNGGPISPSIGDTTAIALLSRVQDTYRDASGVVLATASRGAVSRQFVLALHHGTVTAEAFTGPQHVALVRRGSGPTYMRAAGAHCWRRLGREDPRTLLNVGAPFPENGKVIPGPANAHDQEIIIETADGFWGYLASSVIPSRTAYKSFLTVTINPASDAIHSIVVRAPDHAIQATQTVKPLTAAPSTPNPMPAC